MSAIVARPGFLSEPLEAAQNLEAVQNLKEPRAARKRTDAKVAQRRDAGLRLALYQPEIAANAGAAIRLAACLGLPVLVIEPCGFVWDDRRLRRAGLDYLARASVTRFPGWPAFEAWRRAERRRLIVLSTAASEDYHKVAYRPGDVLLGGRESTGVPQTVHAAADLRVRVPMAPEGRALNLVTALAMVLGEALRQTDGFPSSR
jgi:tRNA (cytidine/uridine-2'-O-)-methyltransferase